MPELTDAGSHPIAGRRPGLGVVAGQRRGERAADRFEAESRAFHEALREAYRQLVTAEPGRCIAIDATEPKPAVADRIWKIVTERLEPARVLSVPAGAVS